MKTMERRRKTPDPVSKKRQKLSAQRGLWAEKAADLDLKLAVHPGQRTLIVKQIEFCTGEIQKCTEALAELNSRSRRQTLAGWGKDNG